MAGTDIGYYTLPVILSFEGIDKQVNSSLGNAFKGIGTRAGKDLGAGLKSAEGDIKRATDAYEKLRDKAEDALGKVRTAEAQLQSLRTKGVSDAGRIAAAEEKLATARRNSTRTSKEAEAAHSALGRSHDDLNVRIGGGSRALTGFSTALEGVSGRLTGTSGRMASFASRTASGLSMIETGGSRAAAVLIGVGIAASAATVGLAAIAAGAVLVGKALYDLGSEFDDISDKFRVGLGATGSQLEALNEQVQRLSLELPSSMGDIASVVQEVNRHLKLTGVEAVAVTKALSEAGRLTGEAVDVKSFHRLAIAYRIDGKAMVGTLDQLFTASQRTGISINDLTNALRDAGPQFRALNLTIPESLALLGQLEDAGIDTSEAVAALKSANSNAAEEGRDFNEYLAETFNRIKALDEQSAIQLAENVFGAKQGQRFAEMIRNGELDLTKLAAMAAQTGDTISKAAQDTADWSEKWQIFKNHLKVGFAPIGTAVFDTINAKLGNLSDWIINNREKIIKFFTTLAVSILEFVQTSIRAIGDFTIAFKDTLEAIDKALGPFINIDTSGLDALPGKLDKVADGIDPLIEKTKELGQEITDSLKNASDAAAANHNFYKDWYPNQAAPRPGVLAEQGLQPAALQAGREVASQFPAIQTIGGVRNDSLPYHPEGRALDVMVPNWESAEGRALGDQIKAWALANAERLGIEDVIWQDFWQPTGGGEGHSLGRRSQGASEGHLNHVHLTFKPGAVPTGPDRMVSSSTPDRATSPGGPGGGVTVPLVQNPDGTWTSSDPEWAKLIARESRGRNIRQEITDSNSGGNEGFGLFQITPDTWKRYGGQGSVYDSTPEQQAVVAANIIRANPSGSDWGAGPGREDAARLLAGVVPRANMPNPLANTGPTPNSTAGHWTTGPDGQPAFVADPSTQPQYGAPGDQYGGYGVPSVRPGYETAPPGSVWGMNEYGQYGYYAGKTAEDREANARAEQAALDRVQAVNEDIAETQKKITTATGDQLVALRKHLKELQEKALPEAERGVADARKAATDLGTFTEAKKAEAKPSTFAADTGSFLGNLAKTGVGGIMETLGIGDWFPDLTQSPLMRSVAGGLSAFKGPLQGALEGKLGIQQPGWQPGQPILNPDTGQYVAAPPLPSWGAADIGVPAPLPDEPHQGGGAAPGPVSQDNSISINYNGPVGSDPEEVRKQQQRLIESRSIPRLPAGS